MTKPTGVRIASTHAVPPKPRITSRRGSLSSSRLRMTVQVRSLAKCATIASA